MQYIAEHKYICTKLANKGLPLSLWYAGPLFSPAGYTQFSKPAAIIIIVICFIILIICYRLVLLLMLCIAVVIGCISDGRVK